MSFSTYETEKLIDYLPEALFLEDLERNILDVNTKACELLGYEKGELLEQGLDKIVPEDRPVFPPDRIVEATRSGNPIETVNFRKDGTKIPLEIRGKFIEVDGKERILISVSDISGRKVAEEKFRKLFDQGPEPAVLLDNNSRIMDVNSRFEDVFNYKLEEIKGKNVNDVIVPDRLREEARELDKDAEQGYMNYETVRQGKNKEFHVSISANPVSVGDEPFVLGIYRNITERVEAEEALREEKDKLKNLHDALDYLQQQDKEGDLLKTTIDVAENILGFEICGIMLARGDRLVSEALSSGEEFKDPVNFDIDKGVAGETIQEGETIWLDDVRDFQNAENPADRFRATISTPMGNIGVLQVFSEKIAGFNERDVEMAEILAGHLKEELLRVRLKEDFREQASHDPLTGLYNRRYFNETLSKEVERCERYGHNIAFLMMDVNRFKEVNDRYTHQTGDEVLREVADLLEENVRDADTVVRYGGDEFLIMLPETKKVESTVDRIEEGLKRWNEESDLLDFPLDLAMGTAFWNPDQERGAEEALKEADKKMYEEKDR